MEGVFEDRLDLSLLKNLEKSSHYDKKSVEQWVSK